MLSALARLSLVLCISLLYPSGYETVCQRLRSNPSWADFHKHVGQIRALGGYARGCLVVAASLAPLALPLKAESKLSLPLSLPLPSPLFTLPEEEQQHVGQIRATGRLRARVFFSCQFRTVQVAVPVGALAIEPAVQVAVVVATVTVA